MKHVLYISTLLSLSTMASGATSEAIVGGTGSDDRVNIVTELTKQGLTAGNTLNLVLDSVDGNCFYRSGSFVVQTMTANDGAGDFNVADGGTIDANSDTAITVMNLNEFKVASGVFTVKNSKSSTALVTLNINDKFIVDNTNYNPTLRFTNVNALIATKFNDSDKIYSQINEIAKLNVESSATVEMTGDELRLSNKSASLNVDGSFKYNGGTKSLGFSIYSGSINVGNTGTFTLAENKALTVRQSSNSTINITGGGKFIMEAGSQIKINVGGINVSYKDENGDALNPDTDEVRIVLSSVNNDTYVATWSANFAQENATANASGVRLIGTSKIINSSNWKIDRRLQIGADNGVASSVIIADSAVVDITSAIAENKPTVELFGNATLILNKVNAITQNTTGTVAFHSAGSNANTLEMSADQKFSEMSVDETLSIFLVDGAKLEIENQLSITEGESLRIYNLAEESVKVGSITQDALDNIEIYDANKNLLGTATLIDGYLALASVPEPAEWAMIFGGIALGWAMYRRRK